MSVPKSQREESGILFLDNARKLEIHTIKSCLKLPKRMTFFLSTEITRLAAKVHDECKAANSIYPTNDHEAQMRRDHLIEANCALQGLIGRVGILKELDSGLSSATMVSWAKLMNEEARLIAGVKKADKSRFKF